jgi:cysteine desulfurase
VTYLDHNATTQVRPQALEAMTEALRTGGNPSSVHAAGRKARAMLEDARSQVAALVSCLAGSVTFTSGGTEANALAIESAAAAGFGRLIISATEHDSVRETSHAGALPV